ncbi:MAG: transglycosylase SLT domain-containing protein [Bacteroidia bacterium]
MRLKSLLFFLMSWGALQAQVGTVQPSPTQLKLRELADREELPYVYNDDIEQSVQDFAIDYKGSTSLLMARYAYYDSLFAPLCQEKGLPRWLLLIPLANTGYEPRFRDSTGACGLWTLPYNIGKKYGLRQTALFDERFDPLKSTAAGLEYLEALFHIYQDWRLVLVAFRQGPIALNQLLHSMGGVKEFDLIFEQLDPNARQTVVQFYACAAAFHRSEGSYLTLEAMGQALRVQSWSPPDSKAVMSLDRSIPYSEFQAFYGLDLSDFIGLNPALKMAAVPYPGEPYRLNLPLAIADSFERSRDSFARFLMRAPTAALDTAQVRELPQPETSSPGPEYVWVYYKIKSGDNVYTLADVFDCSSNQLRAWNRISGNSIVAGKTLKFHVPASRRTYYNSINSMSHAQKKNLAARD